MEGCHQPRVLRDGPAATILSRNGLRRGGRATGDGPPARGYIPLNGVGEVKDPEPVVYVVDDEPMIREIVVALLGAHGYRAVPLGSAEELLAQPAYTGPGCLVLDVFLPGLSGLDVQQVLADSFRHLPIIFMSGQGSIPLTVQAMKAGAFDFLTKPVSGSELGFAVERAIDLSRRMLAEQAGQRELAARLAALSPREVEVLSRVAAGKLNKQIAAELQIVEKTVKFHRGRGMQKLGLRSVAELVRLAEKTDVFSETPRS